MAVGLVVSIFQAVTQIHEATLAFVPKLIAAMVVFAIAGPWMISTLVDYLRRMIESIPSVIGWYKDFRAVITFKRGTVDGVAVSCALAFYAFWLFYRSSYFSPCA